MVALHIGRTFAYAAAAALAAGGCSRAPGKSSVKDAAEYRAGLFATTARINVYLDTHSPANSKRRELAAAVAALARPYDALAAEARPLEGKTGDKVYGVVAAKADDGNLCAGNLAAALNAGAGSPGAAAALDGALRDWAAFNDELAAMASSQGDTYSPRRWWRAPAWRRAAGGARL